MNEHYIEEEFKPKIDFDLWRRIYRFALGHKRLMQPLAVVAIVIAVVESSFPIALKWSVDVIETKGVTSDLLRPASLHIGLSIALATCVYLFIKFAGSISHHIAHDIKRDCFKRLQELEFSFYDKQPSGWLISRLTADCDRLSRILAWGTMDILWGSLFVSGMAIYMLILNWKLGLIVLSTLIPLLLVSVYFQRRMLISSRKIRKHNSRITAAYSEGIAGVKTTKTLGRESENLAEFSGMSTDMFSASIRRAFFSALYISIVMLIGNIGSGLSLWSGGLMILGEEISISIMVAFISYTGMFFFPINQIATMLAEVQGAQAAGERVMGLLATEPKIKDSEEVKKRIEEHRSIVGLDLGPDRSAQQPKSSQRGPDQSPTLHLTHLAIDGYPTKIDTIEFSNVTFAYNETETVLKNFSLRVKQGQTIALVGPSGGGKSTIVSLVSRFYEPTQGEIRFNGIDYRQRSLEWLQGQLGIVLQTPHLFNGSVIDNIRYGRLDATNDEIREAAQIVNAHEFIMNLENGYDTVIGEGGARLSTGERQLISFARALVADPQIFIMDEATSSIDTETERLIQDGMQRIFDGRINFVIAHRLSTIRSADKILVINKGEIEEQGTHNELLANRGHYYELYVNQFRREGESNAIESA